MISLKFTVPLPPSINSQYLTVGRRRVLSKPAKSFKADVKKIVERHRSAGELTVEDEVALRGSLLGIYLTFHFETPFRRDLDGGLKIALDALCEAMGLDDRMVVDLQLLKRVDTLHPRLEIEMEPIEEWSFDPQYVLLADPSQPAPDTDLELE